MQSLVEKPFSYFQSPLDRQSIYPNTGLIYKNINDNYTMKNDHVPSRRRQIQSAVNDNMKRDEENYDDQRRVQRKVVSAKLTSLADVFGVEDVRDSHGEPFRSRTSNKYAHVRSKVDSNLQNIETTVNNESRKSKDEKHRYEDRKGKDDSTYGEKETRIRNEIVWRTSQVPPTHSNVSNVAGIKYQHVRSVSAIAQIQESMEPIESKKLPTRSKSASMNDLQETSVTSLLPTDFETYMKVSTSYQDSRNLEDSLRYYRSYLNNKKTEKNDSLATEHRQQSYPSNNEQQPFKENTRSSVTYLQRNQPLASVYRESRNNGFTTTSRQQAPHASQNNGFTTTTRQTPHDPQSNKPSLNHYNSSINQQYENYLKSSKLFQQTEILPNNNKNNNNNFVTSNNRSSLGRNREYNSSSDRYQGYHAKKDNYLLKDSQKTKDIDFNCQATRTLNLLDAYLQNDVKIKKANNNIQEPIKLFEFPSFINQQQKLSKSWNVTNSQSLTHNQSQSSNNTNSTSNISIAEQMKLMQNLSLSKSLPSIPPKLDSPLETKQDDNIKTDYNTLPVVKSSKNDLKQSVSMTMPAYLNYSNNTFKKQPKNRPTLPILKKKKKVRIALEHNRLYLYTPEYGEK